MKKRKNTNIVSSVTGGIWNFFLLNNKTAQNAIRTYIVVFFLLIGILIAVQYIDFRTKKYYDNLRLKQAERDRIHNIEMTVGKEYIEATTEENVINEVIRRGIPLEESVQPPQRIYYE